MLDYALAPEGNVYVAVEQALAAYELLSNKMGGPEHVVVAGDSAGGGLACALCLYLRKLKKPQPLQAILFSPSLDVELRSVTLQANEEDPILDKTALHLCFAL